MKISWSLGVAASRARHCAVAIAVLAALPPAPAAGAPAASSAGGVTIGIKSPHSAIELAASELAKYLGLMAGDHRAAAVLPRAEGAVASLQLGLFGDFGVSVAGVADPARDDAIYVAVQNSRGVIAGSNPRSVLFAAYRFLEAAGCRWIRPGPDGDYVPRRRIDDLTVELADRAAYRFRGHNNTGTYSLEYILQKIEWSSKVGLNTFFNEWFIPRMNFDRWYSRRYPSAQPPAPRSDAELGAYSELLKREVKRRGMILQAVGHGWNALFMGNPEAQCDHDGRLIVPEDQRQFLALVNGERNYHRLVEGKRVPQRPTMVDLCYGHPEVRRRLVQLVADYAQAHPEIDYLHFWLDDRPNDTCECPRCGEKRAGDHYVAILNGIDRELTRRQLTTRLVFLVYQDTVWPPQAERFANPDRFVLQFSPVSRLYDVPYEAPPAGLKLAPYRLNQNVQPSSIQENVGYLREWQQAFSGPGFAYDYHFVWAHFFDQGYVGFLDVLAEDIRRLSTLGLDGFVSCQNQKSFFPHGLPQHVHARLLWKPDTPVNDLAADYFAGAFGSDGELALEHMKALSALFHWNHFYQMYRGKPPATPVEEMRRVAADLARVTEATTRFQAVIERNLLADNPVRRLSWEHVRIHAGFAPLMADALRARLERRTSDEQAAWQALARYTVEHESTLETVFDARWFQMVFPLFGNPRTNP
jgi:hypothetical protein